MLVQTKQSRKDIRKASAEYTLKQQTTDNLESKQQKVNQYIQNLIQKSKV